MNEERTVALGKFEAAKKDLTMLGIKAGSHLESLRKETDTLLTDKDFTSIDFEIVKTLVDELEIIQKQAVEKIELMKRLDKTYKLS